MRLFSRVHVSPRGSFAISFHSRSELAVSEMVWFSVGAVEGLNWIGRVGD